MHAVVFVSTLLLTVHSETWTQRAISQAVDVGDRVVLSCATRSRSKIRWDFYQPGNFAEAISIHNGYFINTHSWNTSRYTINSTAVNGEQRSELRITNVQFEDAGLFSCSLSVDETERMDANLSVFALPIQCFGTPNSPTDTLSIEEMRTFKIGCNVTYRGNFGPIIECAIDTHIVLLEHPMYIAHVVTDFSFHGKTFNCNTVTKFNSSIDSVGIVWVSSPLHVTFGPKSISINSSERGLRCSSECNPPATYHWVDVSTGEVIRNGSDFDVNDICRYELIGSSSFKCVATREHRHMSVDVTVFHCSGRGFLSVEILSCFLLISVCAITALCIKLVQLRRRCTSCSCSKDSADNAQTSDRGAYQELQLTSVEQRQPVYDEINIARPQQDDNPPASTNRAARLKCC